MSEKPIKIGVIGCGKISETYLQCARLFPILDIAACADLHLARARECVDRFSVERACTVEELLEDESIEIVLNLTVPAAHHEITRAALRAGKHVYTEKPLALERRQGEELLAEAAKRGLRLGCAPDTVLGAGIQTCRSLIDAGAIGRPAAAIACMMCHGHESWHPNPEFYYQPGGGPLFDMGPYYLSALVTFLGPARSVTGVAASGYDYRTITSSPKAGKRIKVETPTHISAIVEFANGAIATLIMSFDIWAHSLPRIEIYGSKGSLNAPDPNTFEGPVSIRTPRDACWKEAPLRNFGDQSVRGLGLADMAKAIRDQRAHRAGGDLAFHVLDIIQAVHESSRTGRHVSLGSTCERPAPMPPADITHIAPSG